MGGAGCGKRGGGQQRVDGMRERLIKGVDSSACGSYTLDVPYFRAPMYTGCFKFSTTLPL
jgi:hypothetical protein